jgi:hypothetical protein
VPPTVSRGVAAIVAARPLVYAREVPRLHALLHAMAFEVQILALALLGLGVQGANLAGGGTVDDRDRLGWRRRALGEARRPERLLGNSGCMRCDVCMRVHNGRLGTCSMHAHAAWTAMTMPRSPAGPLQPLHAPLHVHAARNALLMLMRRSPAGPLRRLHAHLHAHAAHVVDRHHDINVDDLPCGVSHHRRRGLIPPVLVVRVAAVVAAAVRIPQPPLVADRGGACGLERRAW